MCYGRNKKIHQQQIPLISLRSPFNVLHSMLVVAPVMLSVQVIGLHISEVKHTSVRQYKFHHLTYLKGGSLRLPITVNQRTSVQTLYSVMEHLISWSDKSGWQNILCHLWISYQPINPKDKKAFLSFLASLGALFLI